jgi:hypothetical protein
LAPPHNLNPDQVAALEIHQQVNPTPNSHLPGK